MRKCRFFFLTVFFLSFLFLILSQDNKKESLIKEDIRREAVYYREEGYRAQSQNDLKKALMFYQKAKEMDPEYYPVYNDLGVLYENMGDFVKAEEMYKRCLELFPTYLPAYTNLAFLYEKMGNIEKASFYWQKRYEYGKEGEYWREVAKEHLLKLGTYPKIKKEMLEKEAAKLSMELVYQREQERLKRNSEAKLHYSIGLNFYSKGDYYQALKEFDTALAAQPTDKELQEKIAKDYQKVKVAYLKEKALTSIKQSINYLNQEDYLGTLQELNKAISAISEVPIKDKK